MGGEQLNCGSGGKRAGESERVSAGRRKGWQERMAGESTAAVVVLQLPPRGRAGWGESGAKRTVSTALVPLDQRDRGRRCNPSGCFPSLPALIVALTAHRPSRFPLAAELRPVSIFPSLLRRLLSLTPVPLSPCGPPEVIRHVRPSSSSSTSSFLSLLSLLVSLPPHRFLCLLSFFCPLCPLCSPWPFAAALFDASSPYRLILEQGRVSDLLRRARLSPNHAGTHIRILLQGLLLLLLMPLCSFQSLRPRSSTPRAPWPSATPLRVVLLSDRRQDERPLQPRGAAARADSAGAGRWVDGGGLHGLGTVHRLSPPPSHDGPRGGPERRCVRQ